MRLYHFPILWVTCLGGCIDNIDARWTLDHDHVVAARATPPRVREGEATDIDALVARTGREPTVEDPMTAELANPPMAMARSLTQQPSGKWQLDVPDAQSLAGARPALGLPDDAPIPVDIMMTFQNQSSTNRAGVNPFKVKKTVWVGEPSTNPAEPTVLVDDVEVTGDVVVPVDRDVYVSVAAAPGLRVNWLTNVGSLFQDDEPRAYVHVLPDDAHEGQLVVVVRDNDGGVAWRVLPMRAE